MWLSNMAVDKALFIHWENHLEHVQPGNGIIWNQVSLPEDLPSGND